MAQESKKFEVLAWLLSDGNRTSTAAVQQFWPECTDLAERTRLAARVRKWVSLARQPPAERVKVQAEARTVAVTPDEPTPEGPDMTVDREGWLESQCRKLSKDIEKARGSGSWPALNALSKTAREYAAELDAIRRAPAPPATAPALFASTGEPFLAQPFFDAGLLEGLSPLALTLALFALSRIQEGIPFAFTKEHGIPTIDPELVEDILSEADRFGASLEELCGEEAWAPGKRSEAFEDRYTHFIERARAGELALSIDAALVEIDAVCEGTPQDVAPRPTAQGVT